MMKSCSKESDEIAAAAAKKKLPETEASLHARNHDFKEALKAERSGSTKRKQDHDALKAAIIAGKKAKNAKLKERKKSQARQRELEQQKRQKKLAKNSRDDVRGSEDEEATSARDREKARTTLQSGDDDQAQDWEQEEDQLQAWNKRRRMKREVARQEYKGQCKDLGVINIKSTPLWDLNFDEYRLTPAEVIERWDKNLLSSGTSGSVSLSQKKQRANNAAAKMHKATLALCNEADNMTKAALTRNRTFSALEENGLMCEAFVAVELEAEARTERILGRSMDQDVVEQYVIEDGGLERSTTLGALRIKYE